MQEVKMEIEIKIHNWIINRPISNTLIILKAYYKTVKDSFHNIAPMAVLTLNITHHRANQMALSPSSTTMMEPTTLRTWCRDSKIIQIFMMPTQVTFFKNKWIPLGLEVLELLTGLHLDRSNTVITIKLVVVLTIWGLTTIMGHNPLNRIKASESMLRTDALDQRSLKHPKIMEICSLFNKQTVWKTVHK
mgnify:CR=1 FL=1